MNKVFAALTRMPGAIIPIGTAAVLTALAASCASDAAPPAQCRDSASVYESERGYGHKEGCGPGQRLEIDSTWRHTVVICRCFAPAPEASR